MKRLALILSLLAAPAGAVGPDEVLDDPALEERARALSRELRCPVCTSENIDASNAPLARDLRLIVRERLVAGDSDAEILDFVAERYGEAVLLDPGLDGSNLILWAAGPALLIAGAAIAIGARRRSGGDVLPLSEAERDALERLTRE